MQDRSGATRRGRDRSPPAARWTLLVVGDGELRTYPLGAGRELFLGRDLDCDVVLDHHRVSRRHARLCVAGTGDAFAIEDLGSRSGTRAGEALRRNEPSLVQPGDPIAIGPFTLTVVRGAAALAPPLVLEAPGPSALPPVLLGVVRSAAHVLVRDERGAGAHAFAEALHRLSRRGGHFVSIDCAAIDRGLLEAELFGWQDGAAKPGVLEAAGEGTLLLGEVAELPPPLQLGLLRAIERREATRAGGAEPIAIAARLVCATRRDLLGCVEARAFRLDLYYRIAGARVTLR